MKTFEVVWTLYNGLLKRAVDAPNNTSIKAESIQDAWKVLTNVKYPKPAGLEIIAVHLRELNVDIDVHIKD